MDMKVIVACTREIYNRAYEFSLIF